MTEATLSGRSILCIDNYIDSLELLKFTLEWEGAKVSTAVSGDEALFALKRSSIDVVVSDLLMPNENGIEILQKLRGAGYRGPAIALTGLSDDTVRAGALAQGFSKYLIKPVDDDRLIKTISAVVKRASSV